jgi:hypothetical protein
VGGSGSGGSVVAAAGAVAAGVAAAGAVVMAGGMRPEVKVEAGVPCVLLGDYLAQSRAMFLANMFHKYKLVTIWRT